MSDFNRAGQAFLKTAAPRWQKMLRAGEMAEPEALRLLGLAASKPQAAQAVAQAAAPVAAQAPAASPFISMLSDAARSVKLPKSTDPAALDAVSAMRAAVPDDLPVKTVVQISKGAKPPIAVKARVGTASNTEVANARALLQRAPTLEGEALDRLRLLRSKQLDQQTKYFGKHPALYMDSWGPLGAIAPHTAAVGSKMRVSSGEHAGTLLRGMIEHPASPEMGIGTAGLDWLANATPLGRWFPRKVSTADRALAFPVLRHELGEAAEISRAYRARAGTPVPAMYGGGGTQAVHSGHVGLRPRLEENMHARLDPEAMSVFSRARKMSPEDALAGDVLRNAGNVGGHVVQPGTRQARSAERVLGKKLTVQRAEGKKTREELYASLGQQPPTEPSMDDAVTQLLRNMSPKAPFNL